MKRKFVSLNLLLVICLLLLLQACSMFPMAVTNNMGNFSFQLNSPMNAWAVQELDNGYYIWENNTLSFIDLASLTLTPVCGKPDCLHGEEADLAKREACEAFLISAGNNDIFGVSGNKLYFVAKNSWKDNGVELLEMDKNGQNRKILYAFEDTIEPSEGIIHQGIMYLVAYIYDEGGNRTSNLYALNLQKKNIKLELLLSETTLSLSNLTAYDQNLYFSKSDPNEATASVWKMNIQSRSFSELPACEEDWSCVAVTFQNNKLFSLHGLSTSLAGDPQYRFYLSSLDGSDATEIGSGRGSVVSDGNYIYQTELRFSMIDYDYPVENSRLVIYGPTGEMVDQIDLTFNPEGTKEVSWISVYPGKGDHVLLVYECKGERDRYIYSFHKSEIGQGAISPHFISRSKDTPLFYNG